MKPVGKAQENRQSLIDRSHLFLGKFTKYAPDPPLVNGSQMVDQCKGLLGEAAPAGREGRIKQSFARSPSYRYYAYQRKALVADDVRIANYNAGPHTMLLVTQCGVEFHYAPSEFHC